MANIKNSKIVTESKDVSLEVISDDDFSVNFTLNFSEVIFSGDLKLRITFLNPIKLWRNHDYTWVQANRRLTSAVVSPKILILQNDLKVVASKPMGVWVFNPKYPNRLEWILNNPDIHPQIQYIHGNQKRYDNSAIPFGKKISLGLLFTTGEVLEFSRSKIPFSSILSFTDHCDFDTLSSLKIQREFFKKNNIKITKGFFLNHFSKRADNASFERDFDELNKWMDDGHELAYHSLSQSIKNDSESMKDFKNFISPPNASIHTWIDHGYQPYNFTLKETYLIENWAIDMETKKIQNLWTYLDTGMTAKGIINQLNPEHFTMNRVLKSFQRSKAIRFLPFFFRSLFFYHHTNQNLQSEFKRFTSHVKSVFFQRKIGRFKLLFQSFLKILKVIFSLLSNWNQQKNEPFKSASFGVTFFKANIDGVNFNLFQTVEMTDFETSLSPKNIDLLIAEKGLCIAHTYFSVPMKYHYGKIFDNLGGLRKGVSRNFEYLGRKISHQEIWNPSLNELAEWFDELREIRFELDGSGDVILASKHKHEMILRKVNS